MILNRLDWTGHEYLIARATPELIYDTARSDFDCARWHPTCRALLFNFLDYIHALYDFSKHYMTPVQL